MIKKLTASETDARLQSIGGYIDRTKPLYDNPTIGSVFVCGAIRGLDVPMRSLANLALRFGEDKFFILCQNLEKIESTELIEIESVIDANQLTREINSQFPGIFTGDLVVSWGSSQRWFILFDAQLSLGILVVRNFNDEAEARTAYSDGDEILNINEAFAECVAYEIQCLPVDLQKNISSQLFRSWRVSGCGEQ